MTIIPVTNVASQGKKCPSQQPRWPSARYKTVPAHPSSIQKTERCISKRIKGTKYTREERGRGERHIITVGTF